ncbi:MAG: 3D-(3,5/4)-trihydroxycyclohexane-1,2-dione acylhydrolase (decyclizing) [Deinococcus sp.]|nr:3D-(3,5/4)-trihydroxycyclohexane-1,2-dione acylhydrolase (decyclizing) [Deinococcus sp.]
MKTRRLTMAQATIEFLKQQYVERDGQEVPFFAGIFGIFGHGNVAGLGEALEQSRETFRYYQARNEQAMVHVASAFAKRQNRLRTFACTTSIGPGATNLVTGAATATINRLPVLLLPGDIFATRLVAPVLQQLERGDSQDASVNDCFKPVSRYWDRINRPEQIITALPAAMRVLTSPADTGAVTIALPQDVQAEAIDYPAHFLEKRIYHIPRTRPDTVLLRRAAEWISASTKPLLICGGGVLYSEAWEALDQFARQTGIPVVETQAGKGALPWDHPQCLGPVGSNGGLGANILAREADLIVVVGSRLSDFTTASKTAFQNPQVRFIGLNVAEFDAYKHAALPLVCDARVGLEELGQALKEKGYQVPRSYRERTATLRDQWNAEVDRVRHLNNKPIISQGEVIGIVNDAASPEDMVVCAAGGLPGDLLKLWRTSRPNGYHLEYGYSCMGYEIAGGLGAKMAAPEHEVYVMVGDGSYLMLAGEIATSVQEGYKLTIVLLDNHGFACINRLSAMCGGQNTFNDFRFRNKRSGQLDGKVLPIDYAANAASLGAHVIKAKGRKELEQALEEAKTIGRTTVIVIEVDGSVGVPGYESWWDVPVAEVSESANVQKARKEYLSHKAKERWFV